MQKGYYHDYSDIMYFPCLKNCEVCINGIECIKCNENYTSFQGNTFCGICELNIDYINNNTLSENLTDKLTQDYINQNEGVFSMVNIFYNIDINNNTNFSIIIFRASECTKLIFEQNDYIEINLDELNQKINSESLNNLVFTLVNYNYKSILEIYSINPEGNIKINLSEICPECVEENYLKIKNNLGLELDNKLTPVLLEEIAEGDYNIFSEDDSIFNDICYNFNIKKIDMPLNERRKLFYLGKESKQILCPDINCEIKNIFISNATSFCDCGINTDFNYLFTSNDINNNNEEEYNNFIDGKKTANSFLLFKCAKKAFNAKNLKNNIGLYISCGLFLIQLVLLIVYITYKKSKNIKHKKILKSNPPKLGEIANFSISDDLEDDQEEKEIGDFEKKNQKKEKNFFEEKKNEDNILNDDEDDDEGDDEQNIQEKDIDSERERQIENEIIDLGGTITEDNLRIQQNNFKRSRNWNKSGKHLLSKEINKPRNKSKLNFLEEESFEGDEQINEGENTIAKKRSNKVYRNKKLFSIGSKESFNLSEMNEIKNDIYQKTENIKFTDAIKQKEISFWEYYWKLLQLKQPLINLFSPIKCLKLEENNIPTLVKVMRIIFILTLNIFFNIFHLEQKYFRKKFEHFNNKYNLINERMEGNISTSEIFIYGLTHAIISGFISFIICLIIQSIFNFFIFNSRKKLNVIASRKSVIKGKDINKVHEIYEIIRPFLIRIYKNKINFDYIFNDLSEQFTLHNNEKTESLFNYLNAKNSFLSDLFYKDEHSNQDILINRGFIFNEDDKNGIICSLSNNITKNFPKEGFSLIISFCLMNNNNKNNRHNIFSFYSKEKNHLMKLYIENNNLKYFVDSKEIHLFSDIKTNENYVFLMVFPKDNKSEILAYLNNNKKIVERLEYPSFEYNEILIGFDKNLSSIGNSINNFKGILGTFIMFNGFLINDKNMNQNILKILELKGDYELLININDRRDMIYINKNFEMTLKKFSLEIIEQIEVIISPKSIGNIQEINNLRNNFICNYYNYDISQQDKEIFKFKFVSDNSILNFITYPFEYKNSLIEFYQNHGLIYLQLELYYLMGILSLKVKEKQKQSDLNNIQDSKIILEKNEVKEINETLNNICLVFFSFVNSSIYVNQKTKDEISINNFFYTLNDFISISAKYGCKMDKILLTLIINNLKYFLSNNLLKDTWDFIFIFENYCIEDELIFEALFNVLMKIIDDLKDPKLDCIIGYENGAIQKQKNALAPMSLITPVQQQRCEGFCPCRSPKSAGTIFE